MNIIIDFINKWEKVSIHISEKDEIQIIKDDENFYKIIENYCNEKIKYYITFEELISYINQLLKEMKELNIEKL